MAKLIPILTVSCAAAPPVAHPMNMVVASAMLMYLCGIGASSRVLMVVLAFCNLAHRPRSKAWLAVTDDVSCPITTDRVLATPDAMSPACLWLPEPPGRGREDNFRSQGIASLETVATAAARRE